MLTTVRQFGPALEDVPSEPDPTIADRHAVHRPRRDDPIERKVAEELRQHFLEWHSVDGEWIRNAEEELDFKAGDTWRDKAGQDVALELENIGRSAYNIDLLSPSIDLVVNQIRINKLTANFIPMGGDANDATAEVRQGLYRNIERVSKAAIARETAYQYAVSVGRGYWRVLIEDEEGPTFARRIAIRRIQDLHSVAIDPTGVDFDYADAAWCYIFEDVPVDQFKAENEIAIEDLDTGGLELADASRKLWFPERKVRVGEYFRRVWKKREVWQLQDGTEVWKEDAPAEYRGPAPYLKPRRIKEKPDSYLEWRKMSGTQTLEKRIHPGAHIPLIVAIGNEVFRGRRPKIHSGMVRPAMHPTMVHNFMFSRMVDEVGLSPLPHMMSAVGQFSPEQKQIVNTINKHPWANVEYSLQEDSAGRAASAPAWVSPSPNIAAVVNAAMASKDNLERVLNTYAPQRGAQVGDMSGRAMREIKDQGDVSHAAFPDNFNRALYQEALIVNDLMDYVYTEAQAITITQPDEKTRQVLINQDYDDPKTGKKMKHLFGGGKYGVSVDTGPKYPHRQAEAATRLLDLAKIFPPQIASVLDLLIQDLNIPGAKKYAERLRPPGFKEDGDETSVAELQMQIQELTQNGEQAHELIQKLLAKVEELGNAEAIKRLEIASKEKIAAAGHRTQLLLEDMKAAGKGSHAMLVAQLEATLRDLETADEPEPERGLGPRPESDGGAAPVSPTLENGLASEQPIA